MTAHRIPLAAVIGHPVAHSLSPRLHGHWLARYGVPGHYVPLDIAPNDLERLLRTLPDLGFVGANVTIPHKERMLDLADRLTDRAQAIGAVNTLTFGTDGKIEGDNTDGHGFMGNLRQHAPDWDPTAASALVLGAGGAARAVVASLAEAGVPRVFVANRTIARAEALCAEFGPPLAPLAWDEIADVLPTAGLLVNTTSLGMRGQPSLSLPFEALAPHTLVTDIVYAPLETELLAKARVRGCATVDGLGMLLHQAAPGFARWFGREPEVDEALRRAVLA